MFLVVWSMMTIFLSPGRSLVIKFLLLSCRSDFFCGVTPIMLPPGAVALAYDLKPLPFRVACRAVFEAWEKAICLWFLYDLTCSVCPVFWFMLKALLVVLYIGERLELRMAPVLQFLFWFRGLVWDIIFEVVSDYLSLSPWWLKTCLFLLRMPNGFEKLSADI